MRFIWDKRLPDDDVSIGGVIELAGSDGADGMFR
jgi:hypothetical protein